MGILGGRRGLGNNRFVFLLVLGGIALFLHYQDAPRPWQQLKTDVLGVFGVKNKPAPSENPRSRREARPDDMATDTRPDKPAQEAGEAPDTSENQENSGLEAYLPAYASGAQIVRHNAYILQYEEAYEQARWVLHRVPGRTGKAKRSDHFAPDPLVETRSALPSDYAHSGYDRGHMAPAGDFKYDQELTDESFYMSNMSPQNHALNIGFWSDIEQQVRTWAKRDGPLVVLTGPALRRGLPTIGRSTRVAVPEAYFKIVYDPARQKAIAFWVENRPYVDTPLRDATVSIDEIERLTGVDFFAGLPDSIERKLEKQHDVEAWF